MSRRTAVLVAVALATLGAAPQGLRRGPLTEPSSDDPALVTLRYLHAQREGMGLAEGDLELVVRDRHTASQSGVTHLHLRQQIDGIDVFGSDLAASVDVSGRLVALGDHLVRNTRSVVAARSASLSPARAVAAAADSLGLGAGAPLETQRAPGGPAQEIVFAGGSWSRDDIPVKLEYVVASDATLRLAWNVVLRTKDGLHWWNLHVDAATGRVLRKDDWIFHESYRVLPPPVTSPEDGARALLDATPDALASAFGWHDTNGVAGAEFTDTRGNNVFAQEDADADDTDGYRPDGGGALVFDAPLDLSLQPSGYRDASIIDAFYWSNLVHDVLYRRGFDEAAGNFQSNDYGRGGIGGDPVLVDAQDGADIDNANFAAPPDGTSGRMQLYLWPQNPAPRVDVQVGGGGVSSYLAGKALFGAGTLGTAGSVVLALDAADANGPSTTDGCSPLSNVGAITGRIALIDRGTCTFVVKVANAQAAGAIGAIVVNNAGDATVTMSGVDSSITVPGVFLGQTDGTNLKQQLASGVTATLVSPADRDSAFAPDVIVHEYTHGLTSRLTGGPSNASCLTLTQSAGMSEGWSDWVALLFTARAGDTATEARGVAPYLIGEPPTGAGIRNHPYSTDLAVSPLTFADIASLDQPHGVGEVWAVALWEMYWNLLAVYGFDADLVGGTAGNERALDLVIDALSVQPCNPTFVEARDALLAADASAHAGVDRCLIWAAFAKRGIGESASDGGSASTVAVTQSFDVPAECTPNCGDGILQVGEQCDDGNRINNDGCTNACLTPEPDSMLAGSAALVALAAQRRIRARIAQALGATSRSKAAEKSARV